MKKRLKKKLKKREGYFHYKSYKKYKATMEMLMSDPDINNVFDELHEALKIMSTNIEPSGVISRVFIESIIYDSHIMERIICGLKK